MAFYLSSTPIYSRVATPIFRQISCRNSKPYTLRYARNIIFYDRLREIVKALNHIQVIALKGVMLAELIYRDIKLRPMLDVDILVNMEDLDDAHDALTTLHYVQDTSRHSTEWYRTHHFHLAPYTTPDRLFILEVHHHIVPPKSYNDAAEFGSLRGLASTMGVIPIRDFWRRARPVDIASVRMLALAPEDLLLHITLHLLEDICATGMGKLRSLCDMAKTIEQYQNEMDWTQLLQEASDYRVERHLYYVIWLTRELLAPNIPIEVIEALKRSIHIHVVEDLLLKHILMTSILSPHTASAVVPLWMRAEICHECLSAKRTTAKIGALLKLIWRRFSHSAHQANPSLGYLAPLYLVFVHPFSLILKRLAKKS